MRMIYDAFVKSTSPINSAGREAYNACSFLLRSKIRPRTRPRRTRSTALPSEAVEERSSWRLVLGA
jgi:hypothetical protein